MEEERKREIGLDASGDLLLGVFITLFAVFIIEESLRMPRRGHLGIMMSPGFVPLFSGCVLLALSLVLNVNAVRKGALTCLAELLSRIAENEENRRFVIILGCMGIYIILLVGRLPFIAATAIYHLIIFTYLRIGGLLRIGIFTIIATLLVSVLLPKIFEMPVP